MGRGRQGSLCAPPASYAGLCGPVEVWQAGARERSAAVAFGRGSRRSPPVAPQMSAEAREVICARGARGAALVAPWRGARRSLLGSAGR
eukprot:6535390-Alexandrium_andersonii.AAC.1